MALDKVSRVIIGTDGKLRPLVRALIYSALAFWLLSADEFLGPLLERLAAALHATGLSPASVTYYESINLLTTLGGMQVHGLALHGPAIPWAALAWLGTSVLVGVAEEYLFRGYLLQTLWKSLGFWEERKH